MSVPVPMASEAATAMSSDSAVGQLVTQFSGLAQSLLPPVIYLEGKAEEEVNWQFF